MLVNKRGQMTGGLKIAIVLVLILITIVAMTIIFRTIITNAFS
ncbi:MAG: hypothetical protein R6V50_01720 [Thermoplasmatota archaeon]